MRIDAKKVWLFVATLVGSTLFAGTASAQFRNNSIQVGVQPLLLGCATNNVTDFNNALPFLLCGGNDDYQQYYIDSSVDGDENRGWDATHQIGVNIGYSRALGYSLFLETDVGVGMGSSTIIDSTRFGGIFQPVAGIYAGFGVRYMFFDEEHRPFILGSWQTLYMPNTQGTTIRVNPILMQSLWMGPRVGAGYEWFFLPTFRRMGADIDIFFDEVSVQFDAHATVFIDIAGLPLLSQSARALFKVYF